MPQQGQYPRNILPPDLAMASSFSFLKSYLQYHLLMEALLIIITKRIVPQLHNVLVHLLCSSYKHLKLSELFTSVFTVCFSKYKILGDKD